ncbi:hypothetical protein BY996DRAFT_6486666 [Phakopsora pachyrhizi]|nr:hypothetical protein BY996DRAFT_6486666 [Phakopsora pachyrhizi]
MEGLITGSKITTAEAGGLASFPKSTLVGAVHRSERGRSHTRTPTGLWLSQPSDPDRLTEGRGPVRHWMNWHSNRGRGGGIGSTGGEGNLHRQSGPVTVTSGGGDGMIESLIRQNGQNVLKLVAIADGLNNSQVSRDHRQGPGHRGLTHLVSVGKSL